MLAHIKVNGIVQGVGFRPFVYRLAKKLNLKGYVLNLGDAGVEIEVEGDKKTIEIFIKKLKEEKPPLAEINEIKVEYRKEKGYEDFIIRKSKDAKGRNTSIIPPDISICNECIEDMEKQKRRKNYFFTTCTNCGPRFTIIKRLPYDRSNTTMDEFEMCEECKKEYTNPLDRRYHAQTIACKRCGPKIFLEYKNEIFEGEEAIWKSSALLKEGKIIAIKGIGGYHIACIATEEGKEVKRLRKILGRQQKPFALMAKDLQMVKKIAYVSKEEEKILSSYIKPIVLLNKKIELPYVAPGLHNYGIMLPYTGLHILLFKEIDSPLVMTSANYPGLPIIYDEEEIKGMKVDAILFYNRKIWQRCDDSIMRRVAGKNLLIRRSRGFVPTAIKVAMKTRDILAVGAEENVTACFLLNQHAFLTQHIGHVQHLENLEFLKKAIEHFSNLLNFSIEAIACDLHPAFLTTRYAEEIAEEKDIEIFRIQHHHAHVAKAMAEYGLEEAIGIAIDGFGYGSDAKAWGGEILFSNIAEYERLGHLQYHKMPGGDKATQYPIRMLAGILGNEIADFICEREYVFPHGKNEIEVILKQVEKEKLLTSSCGRLLDAISSLLDICHKMDYEGEPAMKLESVARKGKDVLQLEPIIKGNVIETKYLVEQIYENLRLKKEDLAYSAQEYIAKALATLAMQKADEYGIKNIVIAGGCAYNEHLTTKIKEMLEKNGYKFFINEKVPCGDGGISFGQAVVANKKLFD